MTSVFVFGANPAMEAVIRRTLAPQGFSLRAISDLSEVTSGTVLPRGINLIIIATRDPEGCAELVRLLLETQLETAMLLVLNATTSRGTRSLPPWAAATLQWPFFPSDLIASITLLRVGEVAPSK